MMVGSVSLTVRRMRRSLLRRADLMISCRRSRLRESSGCLDRPADPLRIRIYRVEGGKWQSLYPGMQLMPESDETRQWSERLGLPFHEVLIETNGHSLVLVFSDLRVSTVARGAAAFVVPHQVRTDRSRWTSAHSSAAVRPSAACRLHRPPHWRVGRLCGRER